MKQIYVTAPLSRRETDVLRVIGDGKTTAEIAKKLRLSMKTVQEYCARLKRKLHAVNKNQLIRIAVLWRAGVTEIVVKGTRESVSRRPVVDVSADKSR